MNARGKQIVSVNAVKRDMTKIKTIKGKLSERALKMFTRRYGDTLELKKSGCKIGCCFYLNLVLRPSIEVLYLPRLSASTDFGRI